MSRSQIIVLVLALTLLTGCYDRTREGDQSVYQFAWWTPVLALAGSVLGFAVGYRRRGERRVNFLMLVAPVAAFFVVAALCTDQVTVRPDGFTAQVGNWYAPDTREIRFDDVASITIRGRIRARFKSRYEMACQMKTGAFEVIPVGNLLYDAMPEILSAARACNVEVDPGPLGQ